MLNKDIKYSLNDVAIQPVEVSHISHRYECDPYYEDEMLPLMTAPMSSVVNDKNYKQFLENGIIPIIPRTVSFGKRLELCLNEGIWAAFSLKEFEETFIDNKASIDTTTKHALIDVANGHMYKLCEIIEKAKSLHGVKLQIMVGNIANPETYKTLSLCGADYVRLGIGNGAGCLTSSNVGVNYPMASLIDECYKLRCTGNFAKIIADGGIKGYSDIIKALALGADYVMCGSIFNKMLESAAQLKTHEINKIYSEEYGMYLNLREGQEINDIKLAYSLLKIGAPLYKEFYGMSTKKAQSLMGKETLTTSEGKVIENNVEYTMKGWANNFIDYLKSAMSYTNCNILNQFVGEVTLNVISNNAYNSYNK